MRLAAIAFAGFSTVRFADARAYLFAARSLAETGRYPLTTDLAFFRPPAYPVFLVAATLGRPDRIALAQIANALLGAAAAPLLALLSARIFRRRGLAVATGLAAAILPSFVLVCTDVQSEPLFMVLLLLAGLLLLASVDRPSSNGAVLAGIALGLAALTRPSALAVSPLLLAPLADRRYPARARRHLAASGVLGLLLALAPWTLRNALVFHELIPVSDMGGVSLYAGNSGWTRRYYALQSRSEYERWLRAQELDIRARFAEIQRSGPLTPGQRSAAFARMAIQESAADPMGALRVFALKAWHWLRPFPTPWFWPAAVVLATGLLYLALDVLAALGMARAPRRGVAAFCLAFLFLGMAIHVLMQVVWRYRVPYWDPVVLLYAMYAAAAVAGLAGGKPGR